jgi:Rieske 2Fe-2S family protein
VADRIAVTSPHINCTGQAGRPGGIVEQGNWKLVMEYNRECYHCDGATRN